MPNHVTTEIITAPNVALDLIHETTDEERAAHRAEHDSRAASYKQRTGEDWKWPYEELPAKQVTFTKLLPEPENIETGGCTGQHEDGVVCWYSWHVANWGTKWDAYSDSIEPVNGDLVKVRFDTAWAHPYPVVLALSRKYPDEALIVRYADEDLGHNLGSYVMKNGEVAMDPQLPAEGSNAAVHFAHQLKYGEPAPADYFSEV